MADNDDVYGVLNLYRSSTYMYIASYAEARANKIPAQPIKLFVLPFTPQGRSVMIAAKALGVPVDAVNASAELEKKLEPYYLINPDKKFPIMDDSGFVLWESQVIMTYLANAYAQQNHFLYPQNPRLRARVDNELAFDLRYLKMMYDLILSQNFQDDAMRLLDKSFELLEFYLEGLDFIAGENLTLVDISVLPTVNDLYEFGYNFTKHVRILKWFDRTKKALMPYGYDEIEHVGAKEMSGFMKKVKVEGYSKQRRQSYDILDINNYFKHFLTGSS